MKMNIRELHAQFCNESIAIRNCRPKTIRGYQMSLEQFLKHAQIKDLNEITNERLRNFLYEGRMKKNWKPETFLFYFKAIKPFCLWCIKRGYMEENPGEGIEMPKREKKLPKRISKEDALKVLEYSFNMPYCYRYQRYRGRLSLLLFMRD